MSNEEILRAKLKSLNINEDLIGYLEQTISNFKEIQQRLLFLQYVKKLVIQINRPIDQKHYEAFQYEYDQDQLLFNPITWIEAEIEFQKALKEFHSSENQSSNFNYQQRTNAPMPLLRHEDMEKLYHWSRSSLNRRIALGLPYHLDSAGAKFFDVNEVNEWIKAN